MLRKQEYHNNLKTSFNVEGRQRLASNILAILMAGNNYKFTRNLLIYSFEKKQYDRVYNTCLDFQMVFIFL